MDGKKVVVPPRLDPHASLIALLERSRLVRTVGAGMAAGERAFKTSQSGRAARQLVMSWTRHSRGARLRFAGVAVIAAVTAHVGLELLQGPPIGWRWMVLPATVLVQGVLMLAVAAAIEPHE